MADGATDLFIENRTFDELTVGESASLTHTVGQRDIDLFAAATGDVNPAHVDPAYAATDMFHGVIIHGLWGAGLISAVLGTKLPGPGTIYLGQSLKFLHPVRLGDAITATVTVREKRPPKGDVTLDCVCTNQRGETVITGQADTRAPSAKIRLPRMVLPVVRVERHDAMKALLLRASGGARVRTAVVYPCDGPSLRAAMMAFEAGLIAPILIGPEAQIKAVATAEGLTLDGAALMNVEGARAAATLGVGLAWDGGADLLMKGDLHTDELMHAVIAAEDKGARHRRISHVYVMDVPDYPRPLLLTDAAINITPSLSDKVGMVQNAIDLAHMIGIANPRVALLAAVETVSERLPSTLDAAALCKMAERGQITGGVLDGPLGFDNAVSPAAAAEKGIVSAVAGRADILVAPELESANILAKQLSFLSGAEAAGLVMGAHMPIILTSRADSAGTRLASCALGVLAARAKAAP
jgi:phosphate butyryltransferase